MQIILLLHKIEGGKNLNSSWQNAGQDLYKKVALDWMVTESEDMEDKANSSVSAMDMVSMSLFLKENGGEPSVPGGAHLSIWNMGHLFSPLG